MPLLLMGIQVTFLKVWVVIYIFSIFIYAVSQQNKKEHDRDNSGKAGYFILILCGATFLLSCCIGAILELQTTAIVTFP